MSCVRVLCLHSSLKQTQGLRLPANLADVGTEAPKGSSGSQDAQFPALPPIFAFTPKDVQLLTLENRNSISQQGCNKTRMFTKHLAPGRDVTLRGSARVQQRGTFGSTVIHTTNNGN